MSDELFSVAVNEEGKRSLQRFAQLSIVILVLTLLGGTAETVSSLIAFKKSMRYLTTAKARNSVVASTIYILINFALVIVQVIFYRRFAAIINRSIIYSDAQAFNRSFRFLVLQSVCFLLQLLFTFLFILTRLVILF